MENEKLMIACDMILKAVDKSVSEALKKKKALRFVFGGGKAALAAFTAPTVVHLHLSDIIRNKIYVGI